MMKYRVEGYPNLIKQSGACVNVNNDEYQKALARKRMDKERRETASRLDEMESRINEMYKILRKIDASI